MDSYDIDYGYTPDVNTGSVTTLLDKILNTASNVGTKYLEFKTAEEKLRGDRSVLTQGNSDDDYDIDYGSTNDVIKRQTLYQSFLSLPLGVQYGVWAGCTYLALKMTKVL